MVIRPSQGLPNMQIQRTSNSIQPSARIDDDNEWSQASLPWAPENSMAPFAPNQFHPSLQTSYNPSLNWLNDGADYMSAPSYSANQFDPVYQQSCGPAPDSSTFGVYSTAALAPDSAFYQQLNTQDPGLAQLWDVRGMQLPNTAAAVPYFAVNDQSPSRLTEALGFQGLGEDGLASGTSSLLAGYDVHGHDNEACRLGPASELSQMDPALAHDLGRMPTSPASSTLGGMSR